MKKSTIIVILIIVVSAIVYFFMMGKPASVDNSSLLGGGTPEVSSTIGVEILSLLNQIKSLEIDASVFSSPTYQTLVDRTVPVLPQDVGRINPFAPVR